MDPQRADAVIHDAVMVVALRLASADVPNLSAWRRATSTI
jgi:hypothetical protein